MEAMEFSNEDMKLLMTSLSNFHWVCGRNSDNPMAARAFMRLKTPLVNLIGHIVVSVLDEMRGNPADDQIQAMGVHMLRALMKDSEVLKRIILACHGVDVIVLGMQQHPNNEQLLTSSLEAIDELHGVNALLQALDNLKDSASGVRSALWAFSHSARAKWSEVKKLPPNDLVRVILQAVHAHKDDYEVLSMAIEVIAEVLADIPEARASFACMGGWNWLMHTMEVHSDDCKIQRHGCRLLSALGRGGAWADQHLQRTLVLLERTMCRHESNDGVLYWAFWAVQQLNGARALVAPMKGGSFKTPGAMVAALRSLAAVSLGQSDGAEVEDMPDIIEAVLSGMEAFSERYDVLYEGTIVLGRVGGFVVATGGSGELGQKLLASTEKAVIALVRLIEWRLADSNSVYAAMEALAQIADAAGEESPVRLGVRNQLFTPGPGQSEHLVARIVAAHLSNDQLQAAVMWLTGMVNGIKPVLQQMLHHVERAEVQLPAIKTLSWLYTERIELEPSDLELIPSAMQGVMAAMARFHEHLILQQHGCYALTAIVEHSSELGTTLCEEAYAKVALTAKDALRFVRGRSDGRRDPASYNALYLRKEATRCIVTVCAARPILSRLLREHGLHEDLADALKSTAEAVWDDKRDAEAEETLRLELLALSYVLGPQTAILEPLRRWGGRKPAVVRAAADAVVDLARGSYKLHANGQVHDASDPAAAALGAPVQALCAAGCGQELIAAMQAHASDEDLQGRLHLAVGFMNANAQVPAAS